MIHIPSYKFNKYTYNHLQTVYWARWSQQQTIFKTPWGAATASPWSAGFQPAPLPSHQIYGKSAG